LVHTGGTVGDLIDNTAYENGITVISGNKMYAESTAEGALTYILSALRYIPDDVTAMRDGDYWNSPYLTRGLIGKTVGIIGVGAVSRNLMRYMKPFGVSIKVWDTYDVDPEFLAEVNAVQTTFDDVLSSCDIVSVHAALRDATKGLIGERELSLIRDGALFVNTSRGPIIDEEALTRELESGRIMAVLDVFTREPLPCDSPLRQMKNVYLIPHKAGPTYDMRALIGYRLAEDAVRYTKNLPLSYEIKADAAGRMTKHG
ncbi:MAG: hydroxyacid dehydrogenase, partial [Clostridia bacterium]|nr:hydroxyacid dehydrogenase [Clostridia bacterium]